MSRPHKTLRPSTNLFLIVIWGVLAVAILLMTNQRPIILLVGGLTLGIIGGLMQAKGYDEAKHSFLNTSSMLEVRAALKATKWGRRYIYFLWAGNIILVILALTLTKEPLLSVLIGYFSLMFAREIITLKSTFEIYKLSQGVNDSA